MTTVGFFARYHRLLGPEDATQGAEMPELLYSWTYYCKASIAR